MALQLQQYVSVDKEFGEHYFISPKTGDLVVLSESELTTPSVQRRIRLLGVDSMLGKEFLADQLELVSSTTLDNPQILEDNQYADQIAWLNRTRPLFVFALQFLSLAWVAEKISALPPFQHTVEQNLALQLLSVHVPAAKNQCLLTSFRQAAFLVKNRIPNHITIGVWLPTQDMHAWTSIPDGLGHREVLVSENSDNVSIYQPALRFSFV